MMFIFDDNDSEQLWENYKHSIGVSKPHYVYFYDQDGDNFSMIVYGSLDKFEEEYNKFKEECLRLETENEEDFWDNYSTEELIKRMEKIGILCEVVYHGLSLDWCYD